MGIHHFGREQPLNEGTGFLNPGSTLPNAPGQCDVAPKLWGNIH